MSSFVHLYMFQHFILFMASYYLIWIYQCCLSIQQLMGICIVSTLGLLCFVLFFLARLTIKTGQLHSRPKSNRRDVAS